ncbi:MAG: hypothetical protein EON54_09895 [Alcaligenaceae bacterium]|nr:MAG: hypothetical protein EON54_09895 [Alcaligenaceae bacterium]
MGHKFDHTPLLAPGRHFMTLAEIEGLCVTAFTGAARACREKLFYALEGVVQNLLTAKVPCQIYADGSFFTEKPEPQDVDIIVAVDTSVMDKLTEDQFLAVEALNGEPAVGVDSLAITSYPRDHEHRGYGLDCDTLVEGYGVEHSGAWLKGFAVVRLWETDVGNRICR